MAINGQTLALARRLEHFRPGSRASARGLLKFDQFRARRKTRLLRTLHNRFVLFGWCFDTTKFTFFRQK